MSSTRGEARGRAEARGSGGGLPPTVVLALAVPLVLACLVLLFGPFHAPDQVPFLLLQRRMDALLGDRLPRDAASLVREDFPVVVLMFCVLVLGAIPYQLAKRAHAAGRRQRERDEGRRAPRRAAGESSAEDVAGAEQPTLTISVAELRGRADRAGIPWDPAFETAGGARGLLEVLREVRRAPAAPAAQEAAVPKPAETEAADPEPVESTPVEQETAAPVQVVDDVAEPGLTEELDEAKEPVGSTAPAPAPPVWTPSYSGSVYTSTSLYTSERLEGPDDPDEAER